MEIINLEQPKCNLVMCEINLLIQLSYRSLIYHRHSLLYDVSVQKTIMTLQYFHIILQSKSICQRTVLLDYRMNILIPAPINAMSVLT